MQRFLTVAYMQDEDIQLVQDDRDVKYYNELFKEDHAYYFIKPFNDCFNQLFGSSNVFLHSYVFHVGYLHAETE